jgi:hypothetical protein
MTDDYLHSPIRASIERGTPSRHRLDQDTPEHPLLPRIRQAGGPDYFALALNPVSRLFPVVTWATDRPGGVRPRRHCCAEATNPTLAVIVETRAMRHISVNLLDTYLGPQSAAAVGRTDATSAQSPAGYRIDPLASRAGRGNRGAAGDRRRPVAREPPGTRAPAVLPYDLSAPAPRVLDRAVIARSIRRPHREFVEICLAERDRARPP